MYVTFVANRRGDISLVEPTVLTSAGRSQSPDVLPYRTPRVKQSGNMASSTRSIDAVNKTETGFPYSVPDTIKTKANNIASRVVNKHLQYI